MNKTQVFSFKKNDNVQTRIVHVLLVSRIARTIGRALNLNEDLIEAIALSHDIGHPPLGHVGEKILNKISLRELNETFMHNIEGVRNYLFIEHDGKGANLTIQVLDGILCHNGEILNNIYRPQKKTKEEFLKNYYDAYHMHEQKVDFVPMTLEGCVVKLCDVISYAGRDLEDAIRLSFVSREEIPKSVTKVLGNNNRDIVNTLVCDIIKNSKDKDYIKLSDDVYQALNDLVRFNYQYIYNRANTKEQLLYYEEIFQTLFDSYLKDLNEDRKDSSIYQKFLNNMSNEYMLTNNKRKVIDYLSLMTDEYLMQEYLNFTKVTQNNN
jgi:dGTPase